MIRNDYTEEDDYLEADTLVLSFWRKANNRLFHELKGKMKELYQIGDCLSSRRYIDAYDEGYRVGISV